MKKASGRVAFTGLLAALALSFSFLEGLIPALFLACLKGGFALLTRGVTAGLLSISGGVLSALVMWLLLQKTRASLSLVGVCGALSHNAAQLCAAWLLTSAAVVFYLPFLVLFGVLTGLLTGLVLKLTLPPLQRIERYLLQ